MYVRIIRCRTRPGQVEELVRRWRAFIVPQLRDAPGFRRVAFGGDRDAHAVAAVSFWDTQPDAGLLDRAMHDFMLQERALLRGQPTIEGYEVLAEFTAAKTDARRTDRRSEDPNPSDTGLVACPACGGDGTIQADVAETSCAFCDGEGAVSEEQALAFDSEDPRWV